MFCLSPCYPSIYSLDNRLQCVCCIHLYFAFTGHGWRCEEGRDDRRHAGRQGKAAAALIRLDKHIVLYFVCYHALSTISLPAMCISHSQGMGGAVKKAEMIVATLGAKGKLLQQFENSDNPKIHRETTGTSL